MTPTAQVLRRLPPMNDANLLAGVDQCEDAGVYRLRDDLAVVTTTDFFPPLVDDPYVFGQIAAANSLSDVYAMGARPVCALNLVGFPDAELDLGVLEDILRGGADKVVEAGAVIAGGHSVRDAEIKYGLAVTGVVHPQAFVRNRGAAPGDVLVLTKPIGSGILTSAAKRGWITPAQLQEAIDVMTWLNAAAARAMVAAGAHAATDVTGFGLVGHAFEMAQASDVTLLIEATAVPLMTQTHALAGRGGLTRACKSTLEYVAGLLSASGVDETLVSVLADAQTSGGLLISVDAARASELIERIGDPPAGLPRPRVIGRVEPASSHRIRLVP
ncbi:MAG: selenide, water dikinase SelD [Phycisphaerales bacterium]|nr:MAG: selenide, water dikinase SelD [Phycisphaerales bacterium]